jgi:hypothetical protein
MSKQQPQYTNDFSYEVPSEQEPIPYFTNQSQPTLQQNPYAYEYGVPTQQQQSPYDYGKQAPQSQQQAYSYDYDAQQPHTQVDFGDEQTTTHTDTATVRPEVEITPEQVQRNKVARVTLILVILCVVLILACTLSTVIRALDIDGVKSIATFVVSIIINLIVGILCLLGIASCFLNRPGMEKWRQKAAYIHFVGLVIMAILETLYLIITTLLIPLVGIPMFILGMVIVVLFYGPTIAAAGYRMYLLGFIPTPMSMLQRRQ